MNILRYGVSIATDQLEQVAKDGEKIMKQLAPYNTGRSTGKGSRSTGQTKASIHTVRIGDDYLITPGALEDARGRKYVYFAERGNRKGMVGWHFAERTANILRNKYGR